MNTVQSLQAYSVQFIARHLSNELDRILLPYFVAATGAESEQSFEAVLVEARNFLSAMFDTAPTVLMQTLMDEMRHHSVPAYVTCVGLYGDCVGTLYLNGEIAAALPTEFLTVIFRAASNTIKSINMNTNFLSESFLFQILASSELASHLEQLSVKYSEHPHKDAESWSRFSSLTSLSLSRLPFESACEVFARTMPELRFLKAPLTMQGLAAFRDCTSLNHIVLLDSNSQVADLIKTVRKWPRRDSIKYSFVCHGRGDCRDLLDTNLDFGIHALELDDDDPEFSEVLTAFVERPEPIPLRSLTVEIMSIPISWAKLNLLHVSKLELTCSGTTDGLPLASDLPPNLDSLSIECSPESDRPTKSFVAKLDLLIDGLCQTQTSLRRLRLDCGAQFQMKHCILLLQHLPLLEELEVVREYNASEDEDCRARRIALFAMFLNHPTLSKLVQNSRVFPRFLPSLREATVQLEDEFFLVSFKQFELLSPSTCPNLTAIHFEDYNDNYQPGWLVESLIPTVASFGERLQSLSIGTAFWDRSATKLGEMELAALDALHCLKFLQLEDISMDVNQLSAILSSLPWLLKLVYVQEPSASTSLSWLRHSMLTSVCLTDISISLDQINSAIFTKEHLPHLQEFSLTIAKENVVQVFKLTLSDLPHLKLVRLVDRGTSRSKVNITDCPVLDSILLSSMRLSTMKVVNCGAGKTKFWCESSVADHEALLNGFIHLEVDDVEEVMQDLATGRSKR